MSDYLLAGLNSPAVLALTVLYLASAAVTTYDVRAIESNYGPNLPWWVALIYFAEWGLLAAVLALNWRYGLALLAVRMILKAVRVLETLGRVLTYPFDPRKGATP